MLRIGTVIQARLGSSRLPGKVLMPLASGTVLETVVERVRHLPVDATVVIAMSSEATDDALARFSTEKGYAIFRGSETDVLGRYAQAAESFGFDLVFRVCADAPLTDPDGMLALFQAWQAAPGARYVHNRHRLGWPIGAAADLIERTALIEAAEAAEDPFDREHVVPFLQRHHDRFGMRSIAGREDWAARSYYMAIDYPSDLVWFQALYEGTGSDLAGPSLAEVYNWIDCTRREPRRHEW